MTKPTDTTNTPRTGGIAGLLASLSGVAAALLPVLSCPACWPAYAGLLSAMGVGFIDYTPWLLPLIIALLLISLLVLGWQGYKKKSYGPLILGAIGATAVLIGKFQIESDLTLYTGAGLLVTASLWNAWPRKKACAC